MINNIALEFPDKEIIGITYLKSQKDLFENYNSEFTDKSYVTHKNYIDKIMGSLDRLEDSALFIAQANIEVVRANLAAILISQPNDIIEKHEPLWFVTMEEKTSMGLVSIIFINYDEDMQNYLQKNAPEKKQQIDYFFEQVKSYHHDIRISKDNQSPKKKIN